MVLFEVTPSTTVHETLQIRKIPQGDESTYLGARLLGEPSRRPARTGPLRGAECVPSRQRGVIHRNTSSGSAARSSDSWKGLQVLEFGASEGLDRQTNKEAFRRLHKRAAWRMHETTHTGGGRPLDRTSLVMVLSDGVLGTARE